MGPGLHHLTLGKDGPFVICDYHMHLELDSHYEPCRFTLERIRLYVDAARRRGADEIGISEHCNRFAPFRPVMGHLLRRGDETPECILWRDRSFRESLDQYFDALSEAKRAGLPVKASLEVDYLPGAEKALRAILAPYPWDYLLGSVHFLGPWGIDMNPEYGWPTADVDRVYEEYFATFQAAARSGLFDVLAHPDLVKKFGHRPSFPLDEYYDAVARAAQQAGVAVEINTAGLHKPVGELYPAQPLLERFYDRGVPITLASDAHTPEHVARDFDKAVAAARAAGYDQIARFEQRRRTLHPLG